MNIDTGYLCEVLRDLVRIDSVNPALVPGARGEREIAEYVAARLGELGLEIEMPEPEPGRTTVVARLPGKGGGRSLMLNGHLDTVALGDMLQPLSGEVREGRLYGRGSYDMKGSLAAAIGAVKAIVEAGRRLRGDLVIAAVADEEYGSLGTRDLLTRMRTDGAIVMEPTALDVCLAHKGYLWIEVRVEGRAAHGSRFELGIDANLKMGRFLVALAGLERELRARTAHPLLGPPSLHAALLSGGSGLSTYAALATVQVERRTVPGESEAQALAEIQAIVDRLASEDPEFRATVRGYFTRDPFEVAPEAEIVRVLEQAATRVRGVTPARIGDTPWMDAALCQAAGIETVVFGPAGTGAHADIEWVDLASVAQVAEILVETARNYCDTPA